MKEIRVQIPADISSEVERRFFEYNATRDIIGYLMSRDDVLAKNLEKYLVIAENRFTELELMKEDVTSQFVPEGISNYGYAFDFINCCIVYQVN